MSLANDTSNPCVQSQSFHIVVLGSSTAAGSGPSSSDSTWVNRYRKFLQQINAANQVTNLAQGGTTTYQIMPDWYVAPAGRPATNTLRNISEAIRLQADAIIVNMPSNDAANGFTVAEQMANFILIAQVADSAGIPVWVCTTQPRNFSAAKVQLQQDVRDSVLSYFGNKAIDFWTGFADSTGQMNPTFDSGDGVHMNDKAHRILFQRVSAKNILSAIVDTLALPDHYIYSISASPKICGSSWDTLSVEISNAGISSAYNLPLKWEVRSNNVTNTFWDTITGGVNTCELFKKKRAINTSAGGTWQVHASLITVGDTLTGNDFSDTLNFKRKPEVSIYALNDTLCAGGTAILQAMGGDSVVWYDAKDSIVGFGPVYQTSVLQQSATYRASAVEGDMTFKESLFTTTNSSVTFNGIMFDIIAHDSLVIDSLALKLAAAGTSGVSAFYVNHSHFGMEDSAQAWTSWGTDTVTATLPNQFCTVNFGSKTLYPGDTLGVYLMMQNGVNLRYLGVSQVANYTSGVLELRSGTGKAYNFGTSYFPRLWNGEVFYHYGFNPQGDCHKDTLVQAVVDAFPIHLGNDTSIGQAQSLVLDIGSGYSQILWNTGATTSQIVVDGATLGVGQFQFSVSALDGAGCVVNDTIIIAIGQPLTDEADGMSHWSMFPNPANDQVSLTFTSGFSGGYAAIISTDGRELSRVPLVAGAGDCFMKVADYPSGSYWLLVVDDLGKSYHSPLVIHH